MKKLENKNLEFIKLSANDKENNYKNAMLYMVRKGSVKGFTFGMIEKRMELIDAIKKCDKQIELEKADWKSLNEILDSSVWFEGIDVISDGAMREIRDMLKEIKKIL